ncbi:MAG: thermonuclease family protein [Roseibium sp.]|nr:thermonuclease family protein [Roseibium sp.]
MQVRTLILPGFLVLAATGAVLWLTVADLRTQTVPDRLPKAQHSTAEAKPTDRTTRSDDILTDRTALPDSAPLPAEIRDVSPEGVSAPLVTQALTRVEPSERYLELKNPSRAPIPDGPLEFRRVQVLDSATLKAGDLTIRIAHVEPLAPDQVCAAETSTHWPCGRRARTALQGVVRQFKITCTKTEEFGAGEISAVCTRGRIDLGQWLTRYGWANVADDAPETYSALAATARETKAGQWRTDWIKPAVEPTAGSLETLPDLTDILPPEASAALEAEDGLDPSLPGSPYTIFDRSGAEQPPSIAPLEAGSDLGAE